MPSASAAQAFIRRCRISFSPVVPSALGTVITTNHIRCEGEVKALLGIPEDVATWALMPVGWPIDNFGPLTRRPLAEVAHADAWGTVWPG